MTVKHLKVLGLAVVTALGAVALAPPGDSTGINEPQAMEAGAQSSPLRLGLPDEKELNAALQRAVGDEASEVWITVLDRQGAVRAIAFTGAESANGLPLYNAEGELIGQILVSGDPALAPKIRDFLGETILAQAGTWRQAPLE